MWAYGSRNKKSVHPGGVILVTTSNIASLGVRVLDRLQNPNELHWKPAAQNQQNPVYGGGV